MCTIDQIRKMIELCQTLKMRKIIRKWMIRLDRLTTIWRTWATTRRILVKPSQEAQIMKTSKIKSSTILELLTTWKTKRRDTRNIGISAKIRTTWRRTWPLWRKKLSDIGIDFIRLQVSSSKDPVLNKRRRASTSKSKPNLTSERATGLDIIRLNVINEFGIRVDHEEIRLFPLYRTKPSKSSIVYNNMVNYYWEHSFNSKPI